MSQSSVVSREHTALRRRRVYAILAGGLVLGLGAAYTLATWNDSEFAKSTFTAGSFVFQGSTDGSSFSDHASSGGAAVVTFAANPTNLSPDDVVYAAYALKLDSTSTTSATISADAPAATGDLAGSLSFAAVATSAFGCDATAFAGGTAVPTEIAPGDTINLCLQTTVGALTDSQQGDSADVVWQWDAVSKQ